MDITPLIRTVKDYPRKGVNYRDLSRIYLDPEAFKYAIDRISLFAKGRNADKIASLEGGGYTIGGAVAQKIGAGFIPIRRFGKHAPQVVRAHFLEETKEGIMEAPALSVSKGDRVVICDDTLSTGSTLKVMAEMLEHMGAKIVGIAGMVELESMKAREKLEGIQLFSVVKVSDK